MRNWRIVFICALLLGSSLAALAHVTGESRNFQDTELAIKRARYLNPNTGRFWTMDSTDGSQEDPLSLNKYLYAADNPVIRIDPSGHDDGLDSMIMPVYAAIMNISTTSQGALSIGDTCGPDVTRAVFATELDVGKTFVNAGRLKDTLAMLSPLYDSAAWDTQKLNDLGHKDYFTDFGNGSSLGTGLVGKQTVQFESAGKIPGVYYAGSVNYFLWGRMFSLAYTYLTDPLTGFHDNTFSESSAIAAAKFHKSWIGSAGSDYEKQAVAFVKFGFDGENPSSTALTSINPKLSNIALPSRFNWKWVGLHDNEQ